MWHGIVRSTRHFGMSLGCHRFRFHTLLLKSTPSWRLSSRKNEDWHGNGERVRSLVLFNDETFFSAARADEKSLVFQQTSNQSIYPCPHPTMPNSVTVLAKCPISYHIVYKGATRLRTVGGVKLFLFMGFSIPHWEAMQPHDARYHHLRAVIYVKCILAYYANNKGHCGSERTSSCWKGNLIKTPQFPFLVPEFPQPPPWGCLQSITTDLNGSTDCL